MAMMMDPYVMMQHERSKKPKEEHQSHTELGSWKMSGLPIAVTCSQEKDKKKKKAMKLIEDSCAALQGPINLARTIVTRRRKRS